MHEVSIAENIIEIIEREADKNNSYKILRVKLLLGEFTSIVKDALLFALDILKTDTKANDAFFEIEQIKLKTACFSCGEISEMNNELNFNCAKCNGVMTIIEGKELEIEYIDLD